MTSLTVKQAILDFYDTHDFGEEGGINDRFAWIKFGFISIPIPNIQSRSRNIYMHDVSHIITGNDTTWKGESAVSAWEIASGGWGKFWFPWLLTLWAMGLGVVFYPMTVLKSFKRGLTMRNAQTCGLSKAQIFEYTITDLHLLLSDRTSTQKSPMLWMMISFIIFISPFVMGILSVFIIMNLFS